MRVIERVFLMAGFLCGLLSVARAETVESISIRVFAHKTKSYVNDKLTIYTDGRIVLDSHAPLPAGRFYKTTQNQIGRFTGSVSKSEVRGLRRLLTKLSARSEAATDGITYEVTGTSIGKPIIWVQGEGSRLQRRVEHRFARLRQLVLKRPVSALKLMCSSDEHMLACAYVNVGTTEVRTIDPLGLTNSIFCHHDDGERVLLGARGEEDPRKMNPDTVVLEPGRSYAFTQKLEHSCSHRIVVTTVAVLENSEYSNHLLGELVSNSLR